MLDDTLTSCKNQKITMNSYGEKLRTKEERIEYISSDFFFLRAQLPENKNCLLKSNLLFG